MLKRFLFYPTIPHLDFRRKILRAFLSWPLTSKLLATVAPFSSSIGIGGAGEGGISPSQAPDSRRGAPPNREGVVRLVSEA